MVGVGQDGELRRKRPGHGETPSMCAKAVALMIEINRPIQVTCHL